ncbi:MAG: hypothetical protein M3Y36_00585 [Actinomycetota bacterium]|nr:hypothetical protein [Actinomycetota bacterium]
MRAIEVHGGEAQAAVPNTQPRSTETKVADWTLKPAGTGPLTESRVVGVTVTGAGAEVVGATVVVAALVDGAVRCSAVPHPLNTTNAPTAAAADRRPMPGSYPWGADHHTWSAGLAPKMRRPRLTRVRQGAPS